MKTILTRFTSVGRAFSSKLILSVAIVMTIAVSCGKDEESPQPGLFDTINGKWEVNGSSEFESFEFNQSGNYIVVVPAGGAGPTVQFGTYEVINNTTVELSNFGTISEAQVGTNSIDFKLEVVSNPGSKVTLNASKKAEMASSSKTALLCRTWKLVSVDGVSVVGTPDELTVLFSKAGTYFVSTNATDVAEWKWKTSAEVAFFYTWSGTFVDEDYVDIIELTASTLKIDEDGTEFVLTPVINP